jgi:hypothetical protein
MRRWPGFWRRLGVRDSLAARDAAVVGLTVAEFLRAVEEDWPSWA